MTKLKAFLAVAAALFLASSTAPASADPVKNIVLVHGAWVDASGWKPVYEILTKQGFHVTMVQEPETSFADDVAATKRILDLQDGPTILVGHSYGGSIITEAGVHPERRGLGLRRRARPRCRRRRRRARREDAERAGQDRRRDQENAGRFHLSRPRGVSQAVRPRSAARAGRVRRPLASAGRGSVFNTPLTAAAWKTKPSWAIVAGNDQIINPDLERWYYERAKSET